MYFKFDVNICDNAFHVHRSHSNCYSIQFSLLNRVSSFYLSLNMRSPVKRTEIVLLLSSYFYFSLLLLLMFVIPDAHINYQQLNELQMYEINVNSWTSFSCMPIFPSEQRKRTKFTATKIQIVTVFVWLEKRRTIFPFESVHNVPLQSQGSSSHYRLIVRN